MSQKNEKVETIEEDSIFDPTRWGLADPVVGDLSERLHGFWSRFRGCLTTQTWDNSEYGFVYLRGLLTMDTNRNYANIARRVIDPMDDGQNLQHFMSDSPWSTMQVFEQIQTEIQSRPELQGGVLTLDESGDKRSGPQSAGTSRQYIGRMGKVELGQVGVALGYYRSNIWTMVDAELYLPEVWFEKAYDALRKRWHIPKERTFVTKTELGLKMIKRAQTNGLPFEVVCCDSWYGRDRCFRADLADLGLLYIADVPADTQVYLSPPQVGIPQKPVGRRGRPFSRKRVVNSVRPVEVRTLVNQLSQKEVTVRSTERGWLIYRCAILTVWTLTEEGDVQKEKLFVWQKPDGNFSFSLSNVPDSISLTQLAQWRSERYFAERTFQDAKTEAGWDELVARKYRAFMHHTAIDALALWFVAETKLDWSQQYPRDSRLTHQLKVNQLPALSMANVREMLKAVFPLKQLSAEQATQLVIKHLVSRSRSTRCRLKAQRRGLQQGSSP